MIRERVIRDGGMGRAKRFLAILCAALAIMALVSCKTGEKVGRALDRGAEKTGKALKKAGKATGKALERTGERIEETIEE